MAIPLFMAGEHRVVTPRTHFLIHEVGYSFNKDSRCSITELQNTLNDMNADQLVYAEYVAARSGGKLTTEEVLRMMRANTHLRGAEAVKLGIAHELID
jgi:ATP-dependent protease ClpP protease subunit